MKRDAVTDRWHRRLYVVGSLDGDLFRLARQAHQQMVGYFKSKRGDSRIFVNLDRDIIVIPSMRPEYDQWLTIRPHWLVGSYSLACNPAATVDLVYGDLIEHRQECMA